MADARKAQYTKALDDVLAQINAGVERLESLAMGGESLGLPPLNGGHTHEVESSEDEDVDGADGDPADTTVLPHATDELLRMIAVRDFGVMTDDVPSSIATPAMKAYNLQATAGARVDHRRGMPLPEGFRILKVRSKCAGR